MITRIIASVVALTGFMLVGITPAQAAVRSDYGDVMLMVAMGKEAWRDTGDMESVCEMFYARPYFVRDYMASRMRSEVYDYEYSMYDTKRAAWRILNWGC